LRETPGTYGISFQAYNLGSPLFAGGNGSVIQVENPGCVPSCGVIQNIAVTNEPLNTGISVRH
jgi:hypothetical protein